MNKIEQMNCHVLFKQVHTMLCICTLEKMRSQIWWMDEFGILRPFQQYFSHIGRWKGEHERLCAMKCRLCSGRISPQAGFEPATRWSEVGTARKPNLRPTTLPLFSNLTRGSYGNRQNVPRIKTEQYSKYIFNINPLAFFMKPKKINVSGKIRSRDLSIARYVFYHCTVLQVEVFRRNKDL